MSRNKRKQNEPSCYLLNESSQPVGWEGLASSEWVNSEFFQCLEATHEANRNSPLTVQMLCLSAPQRHELGGLGSTAERGQAGQKKKGIYVVCRAELQSVYTGKIAPLLTSRKEPR
ncbi:hypothetical protein CEXT_142401 [Caerostris extrusa]|uniref:Uncharacterized protein n=1 Tax=Caerostris extrusa TaxID=172846 RepID=A0AAV4ULH4_CAEEX|nr:hypothetical protein CEXT_142401 [Caerostris extrusa]